MEGYFAEVASKIEEIWLLTARNRKGHMGYMRTPLYLIMISCSFMISGCGNDERINKLEAELSNTSHELILIKSQCAALSKEIYEHRDQWLKGIHSDINTFATKEECLIVAKDLSKLSAEVSSGFSSHEDLFLKVIGKFSSIRECQCGLSVDSLESKIKEMDSQISYLRSVIGGLLADKDAEERKRMRRDILNK